MTYFPCSVIVLATLLSGLVEALSLDLPSHRIQLLTRARFLSTFVASSSFAWTYAQEECSAASNVMNDNPRYIDQELQMKYGENKGALDLQHFLSGLLHSFHEQVHSLFYTVTSSRQVEPHALGECWYVASLATAHPTNFQ